MSYGFGGFEGGFEWIFIILLLFLLFIPFGGFYGYGEGTTPDSRT